MQAFIGMPVGTVTTYAASAAPDGWLLCDGSSIDRNTYPSLYGLIGGTLPDLRSRFIVGAGKSGSLSNFSLNQTGGEETHTLTVEEIPSHSHDFGVGGGGGDDQYRTGTSEGYSKDNAAYLEHTFFTGGSKAHNNLPPFYALTYIIKY